MAGLHHPQKSRGQTAILQSPPLASPEVVFPASVGHQTHQNHSHHYLKPVCSFNSAKRARNWPEKLKNSPAGGGTFSSFRWPISAPFNTNQHLHRLLSSPATQPWLPIVPRFHQSKSPKIQLQTFIEFINPNILIRN